MANRLYAKAAERQLGASPVNFLTDTIKIALVKNTYTENMDTDEFYSSLAGHTVGVDQTLAGKSITGGKFDADNPTWTAVAAGDTLECFVIYKDTGVAATSPLIARIDAVSGLPFLTTGGDVAPVVDPVNGLIKLVP